jgi:proline iminopeptidase
MDLFEEKTDGRTLKSGHLDVGEGHQIWYEQWGNPNAKIPVLMFHGGPGSSFKPHHRYSFDPDIHQTIGFDQRGCGNSLPRGGTEHNTTEDLLNDAVKILDSLGVEKVYVKGGSWGSTLALLFSAKFPERVVATVVNGIFTATPAETDYVDKGLFRNFYPEVWERFVASVPAEHAKDPAAYHYKQMKSSDPDLVKASARALEDLESPLLDFDWEGYKPEYIKPSEPAEYDEVPYKIYAHYLENSCFMPDGEVLKLAATIKTPLYIVQGRYDMVCPPHTAYKLHKTVAGSKLFMTLGSHGYDPENRTAIKALIETVFI